MHAWIVKYSSPTLFTEDGLKKVEAEFLPLRRQTPGFLGYYLTRVGDYDAVAVSLWRPKKRCAPARPHTAAWVRENVVPYLEGTPETFVGPVVARTEASAP